MVLAGDDRDPPAPRPRWTALAHRLRRIGSAGRLAAFHAVLLAVVLGAVVVALVRNFTASYETIAANGLIAEVKAYAVAAQARPTGQDLRRFSVDYLSRHALASGSTIVVALTGVGRVETSGGHALAASPAGVALAGAPPPRTVTKVAEVGGRPVELVAAPIREHAQVLGTFLASSDLTPFAAERSRVLALSIAEALVALVAGVGSTFWLLRRLLGTVGRITTTADAIGRGSLDHRLGDQGSDDEVGRLAQTFDAMLGRIDTAMTAQRRLLSDVSHQLRTPLTVARGHLEILQRTGLDDPSATGETVELVIDELDHMRALVERLLLLGRAMEPDFLAPEPVDLRSFLADVHEAASVLAARRFVLAPVPDVVVEVDAAKLRGALLNLIDNAVRATRPGDTIALGAALRAHDGALELVVEDSGPGIPAHEREAALRRFARPGARDADGSGLGLAIVKAVAETHGGAIAIEESALGGARVAVVLPARRLVTVGEL